ncbi:hypothetical protein MLD38_002380 [Melastoma candidum]|uniref:Uncharacterized protein n=1 Tax=Melastoma candidum TaxID=119954 RepID=A0ACB9RYL9_9MYRT|nr:hypothetical protein MLD38_002380 [Melastoma candidum]
MTTAVSFSTTTTINPLYALYFSGNGRNQQVVPLDYQAEASQRLVDAVHASDADAAISCLRDPFVDVNHVGTVSLRSRRTEVVPRGEESHHVAVEYEEFRTDVTALFLAAHSGDLVLVRKLLSAGADANMRLFRGYSMTAAVRERHTKVVEVLVNARPCYDVCEEALLEASCVGVARIAELLMASKTIRPHVAIHALVLACCRGFVDVVDTLIKCGVNANGSHRILLQSSKPSLHINADCCPLVAAIISRQVAVVKLLLKAGVSTEINTRVGTWSWDVDTGEEFRVGAGLAEPYGVAWCAVEFFESRGEILLMLLQQVPVNARHHGRTLVHHAILCNNEQALKLLLENGADAECPIETTSNTKLRPIHLAARLGYPNAIRCLISARCDLNSQTESGDTALMIAARNRHGEALKTLVSAGADLALVNSVGQCARSIAQSVSWSLAFQEKIIEVIRLGKVPRSSNPSIFSSLLFVVRANNIDALRKLLSCANLDVNERDADGNTAVMLAAADGYVDVLRLLVHAGANMKLRNKEGSMAEGLAVSNQFGEQYAKIMRDYMLGRNHEDSLGFNTLHSAAEYGQVDWIQDLIGKGHDVNAPDYDGCTPLMLAAKGGYGDICRILISHGARCNIQGLRNETALSLLRENGHTGGEAEAVILDGLAKSLVLKGSRVKKHTKCGKGSPHNKVLKMEGNTAVLQWGHSSRRNVICKRAELGPSTGFSRNRRGRHDVDEPGMFHVVTTKDREVHFVCEGGDEKAQLWVRGIKLITREIIFGQN